MPRHGVTVRPRLEALEAREVPATVIWAGAVDSDAWNEDNWDVEVVGSNVHDLPQAGDNVVFAPLWVSVPPQFDLISTDCVGFHGLAGAYHSVTVQSDYDATVTLIGGFTTGDLTLAGGTLDQPSPTSPYANTDITVTDDMVWTGTTLNSTSHLANLTITGEDATMLFQPNGGGTLNCGSNITLEDGAIGTMREGTLNVTNEDQEFNIEEDCELNVDPGEDKTAAILTQNVDVGPKMLIQEDAWVLVLTGTFDVGAEGQVRNIAGALVLLHDAKAYFRGVEGGLAYDQLQAPAFTVLWPGSELRSDHPIRIQNGKLVTIGDSAASTATIDCPTLSVTGGEVLLGRNPSDFSIHYSQYYFSVLKTTGSVEWTGGTYRPYMQAEDETGALADLWWATAEFKVGTATASPTLTPVAINYENSVVTPPTGLTGLVLKSSNLITKGNNNAPNYDTNVWILDSLNNGLEWWMRGK